MCGKGCFFLFQYFSDGIIDRVKGHMVTADSHAGKLWIGVGVGLGRVVGVFFMSPLPGISSPHLDEVHTYMYTFMQQIDWTAN